MHQSVISVSLAVATETSNKFEWVQITTGMIGIPGAVLGIYGAWFLAKKARLESRKLSDELKEKEQELAAATAANDSVKTTEIAAEPTFQGRRVQDLILRAILLLLILNFWNLIRVISSDVLPGIGTFVLSLQDILSTAYWLIFIGMGWPLLTDLLHLIRINVPKILQSRTALLLIMLLVAFVLLASAWRRELLNS